MEYMIVENARYEKKSQKPFKSQLIFFTPNTYTLARFFINVKKLEKTLEVFF